MSLNLGMISYVGKSKYLIEYEKKSLSQIIFSMMNHLKSQLSLIIVLIEIMEYR